jgi:hypothetical protein
VAIFEQITLTWKGREYVIPPDNVLRCIAMVEDVLPLGVLAQSATGDYKLAKLAAAFAVALRYAGAKVTDEEVYSGMFEGQGADLAAKARAYVFALQAMMIPPEQLRSSEKTDAAGARAASSQKRTSSRSGKAG